MSPIPQEVRDRWERDFQRTAGGGSTVGTGQKEPPKNTGLFGALFGKTGTGGQSSYSSGSSSSSASSAASKAVVPSASERALLKELGKGKRFPDGSFGPANGGYSGSPEDYFAMIYGDNFYGFTVRRDVLLRDVFPPGWFAWYERSLEKVRVPFVFYKNGKPVLVVQLPWQEDFRASEDVEWTCKRKDRCRYLRFFREFTNDITYVTLRTREALAKAA